MALDTSTTLSNGTEIRARSVGSMDNIAYLITPMGGRSVLIDAAADPGALTDLISAREVATIITTHRHPDHWQALANLAEHTGAELIAGTPDAEAIAEGAGVTIDATVWEGDRVIVDDLDLQVIALPGHTPGGIALVLDTGETDAVHVFTGDCLFPGGVGKTHSPEEFTQLLDGVETKLFNVHDDDTVIHPGHGNPTTLGEERGSLAEWRERGW
ncbi:MAG: MBL fold metallo-hydrolase [Propionibacterium sp.]|nr:MBL fold metallo-hydrolase [Propionibacterium sp.]